jgi:amino-acid N-acetyltransferase
MTAVKTTTLWMMMMIIILGVIWSRKTATAFVVMSPSVTMHSSHYRQLQQQLEQQQQQTTTTTLSLATRSSLTSNVTDTSLSPTSTIRRGGGRVGTGRPAAVSAASAAAARETVAGPWEASSHVTTTTMTMTSRRSFLEERKRLMDFSSSPSLSSFLKRSLLIDPSTVEICDSEEVNRRLELEISKSSNSNGKSGQQQQQNQLQLLDTGHNRRNADKTAADSTVKNNDKNKQNGSNSNNSVYPFALMMQQSARYIAQHWGKTVVFHIPGNLMADDRSSNQKSSSVDKLLGDLAQAWILGMKIVVVVGNRFDWDLCDLDATAVSAGATSTSSFSTTSSSSAVGRCSSNALQVTSEETLRLLEEEAGYWRTEVERKLNKCLHGVSHHAGHLEGNVVSGNFYTAKRVVAAAAAAGRGRRADDSDSGSDDLYDYTGYAAKIHTDTIRRILHENHDVVVLSTVGLCRNGNLINVNGYHLAASVAASLNAYKVVYMAHQGSVLQQQMPTTSSSRHKRHGTTDSSSSSSYRVIQELPISCAKAITDYHNVRVHKQGFATFEHQAAAAQQQEQPLSPRDLELLLHLGWATWAVERGVTRAHIVNPTDGALLEELFTSKNGANTCIFHDKELLDMMQDDDDDDVEEIYWRDDDDDDSSSATTTTPLSQHGYGPILTSPTAFSAKKSHGSSHHQNKNNHQLGRNAAFFG